MKKVVPLNALLIPDNAKKAFEGQIFDFYQWPQEMYDGSTKIFEMLRRPDTVQVIAIKNNKIVLVNDEQPGRSVRTHFPGGRVDNEDRSWLDAAKRELREETGLSYSSWRLIGVEQPVPKIEWFVPLFLAEDLISEEAQNLDVDGEKIEVVEWEFDKLRSHILDGEEMTLNYAIPLMNKVTSLKQLQELPEFTGKEVII